MSYTGTQVYFPASTTFDAVRSALAEAFPEAALRASDHNVVLAFDDTKVIRVSRDDAAHVPEEAAWHGSKTNDKATRAALERASHRYEIVPDDPRADFDDMYNELLFVFEALRALPDAVGADPFDGALYHDPEKATGKARARPKAKAKAKAKTKAKPKPRTPAKRKTPAKKKKRATR